MIEPKYHKFNNLECLIYDFPNINDELPIHSHDEKGIHITIVSRGSFKIFGDDWEIISSSGDVMDWQVGQQHGFISLEPNSRLVNILKNFSISQFTDPNPPAPSE